MTGAADDMKLEGLDGTVTVTATGVRFERTKVRSFGRGPLGRLGEAPWSAITGATGGRKEIRVGVVGHQAPRMGTSDPWQVTLRRGQEAEAQALIAAVEQRCTGFEAEPSDPQLTQPPVRQRKVKAPRTPEQKMDRLLTLSLWTTNIQLVLLLIPVIAFVVVIVALAVIFLG